MEGSHSNEAINPSASMAGGIANEPFRLCSAANRRSSS
jgi:hypothetical protein